MEQSDVQLIRCILQGDQEAFSVLVKKYQKGAHALAWRKTGDFHIAQEITQDAFLNAYKKLGTLKNHNAFAGWLYVIVARLCADWLRENRLPMESLDTTNVSEMDKVSYSRYVIEKQAAEADETRREIVKELLKKLPESERTVVTLHYLGEMTIKAISEFLGVSQNTVKSRLSRARNRLRKEKDVLQQNLGSFQLPDQLTENIMREVARLRPVPAPTGKPVTPLALSAASAVVLFLLIGIGTQHLTRFQKPYNLDASSEPTVEIIDAVFIYDSPAKPAVRTQSGSSVLPGKSLGAGQTPDEPLFSTLPVNTTEAPTPKPQWTQTGGPEGGVQNLFITSNGDTYAGTGTDLYRLTDDRHRWNLVNANMPLDGSWQMTERNDTLYVVSDTEILASMDRGETWNPLGTRPEGELIDLVITDEVPGTQANIVMYLALVNGVFRSTDAGNSWTPVSEQLLNKEIRAITAVENVMFVGTDSGLYRRNSEGWTLLSVGESQNIRAVASAGHRLYVAVGEKAVNQEVGFGLPARLISATSLALYRSTDLGDSWQTLDFRKRKTEPSSQDGMTMHIASGPSESYQKDKGGSKDSETKTTSTFKMVAVEESLFAMDDKGSYYSSDAGENWVTLDPNIPDIGDVFRLVSVNANTFYRNGTSGIYRTTDVGKTWHPFSTGLVNTSVMNLVSAQNVLYANVGGELLASSNGGEVWTPVPSSPGNITNLAKFNDVLYARGIGDARVQLLRLSTEDNQLIPIPGMSFLERSDYTELIKAGAGTVEEIQKLMAGLLGGFAVSRNTYYMEYEQRLFRWKTGTSEWVDTGLIDEGEFIDTAGSFNNPSFIGFKIAVSGRTVYVAKLDGRLFQSFDEGDTWNDVTGELPFSFTHFKAIEFAGSAVYVATDRGVAYSSDGTHWHVTSDPEGVPIVIDEFAVSGTTLYGVTEQRVYELKENSDRWQQMTPEIPSAVSALVVDGNVLYVGTYGSGVLRFKLDD